MLACPTATNRQNIMNTCTAIPSCVLFVVRLIWAKQSSEFRSFLRDFPQRKRRIDDVISLKHLMGVWNKFMKAVVTYSILTSQKVRIVVSQTRWDKRILESYKASYLLSLIKPSNFTTDHYTACYPLDGVQSGLRFRQLRALLWPLVHRFQAEKRSNCSLLPLHDDPERVQDLARGHAQSE